MTGENIILEEGNNEVGDFVWSPDSSNLAYATCRPSEDYSVILDSSVKIFSLESHLATTIFETKTGFLRIDRGEVNHLRFFEDYNYPYDYMYYDWSSHKLMTPTVTPTP